jgi:hypothetical protein
LRFQEYGISLNGCNALKIASESENMGIQDGKRTMRMKRADLGKRIEKLACPY